MGLTGTKKKKFYVWGLQGQYTTLWLWKPEFNSRIGHHVTAECSEVGASPEAWESMTPYVWCILESVPSTGRVARTWSSKTTRTTSCTWNLAELRRDAPEIRRQLGVLRCPLCDRPPPYLEVRSLMQYFSLYYADTLTSLCWRETR